MDLSHRRRTVAPGGHGQGYRDLCHRPNLRMVLERTRYDGLGSESVQTSVLARPTCCHYIAAAGEVTEDARLTRRRGQSIA